MVSLYHLIKPILLVFILAFLPVGCATSSDALEDNSEESVNTNSGEGNSGNEEVANTGNGEEEDVADELAPKDNFENASLDAENSQEEPALENAPANPKGNANIKAVESPALQNAAALPPSQPEPAKVEEAKAQVASPTPEPVASALPVAQLWWIGFDFDDEKKKVYLEFLTKGKPSYNLSQKKTGQGYELIVHFEQTALKPILKRGIDTSEFLLSPIAYIQAAHDPVPNRVDVVVTLRQGVKPKLFANQGNLLFTFDLPKEAEKEVNIGKATEVNEVNVLPVVLAGSDKPASYVPSHAKTQEYEQKYPSQSLPEAPIPPANTEPGALPQNPALNSTQAPQGGTNQTSVSHEDNALKLLAALPRLASLAVGQDKPDEAATQDKRFQNADKSFETFGVTKDDVDGTPLAAPNPASASTSSAIKHGDTAPDGQEDLVPEDGKEVKSTFRPISMEFKGAKLKDVLAALAKENGANFIINESVASTPVTLKFWNVAWDQALQAILESNKLGMTKLEGNVIRIDTLEFLSQEKQKIDEVRKSFNRLTPTKIVVMRLSNSRSADVLPIVQSFLVSSQAADDRVKVQSDVRTNSLVVEAIPTDLEKIKALVDRLDLQTPQVKIATRIIEVLETNNLDLGINWAMPIRSDQGAGINTLGGLVFPNSFNSAYAVDTGIAPDTKSKRGSADFHFGSVNNTIELDLRLRMAEAQSITRSLQNSSVLVLDNQLANLESGSVDFFPLARSDGQGGQSNELSQVTFTLKLQVKPHITADGSVDMEITVTNDAPKKIELSSAQASKSTRSLTTRMVKKSGETVVIGGLYTQDNLESWQGIPFFSKLPILGVLFRANSDVKSRRELVIMVTPTVVMPSVKALADTASESQDTMPAESENANNIGNSEQRSGNQSSSGTNSQNSSGFANNQIDAQTPSNQINNASHSPTNQTGNSIDEEEETNNSEQNARIFKSNGTEMALPTKIKGNAKRDKL